MSARLAMAAAMVTSLLLCPSEAAPTRASLADGGRGSVPSRLESEVSRRAGVALRQYGYELFAREGTARAGGRVSEESVVPVGSVAGDYVLGPGDEVLVAIRGRLDTDQQITIDGSGNLVVARLPPIVAAGSTLDDLRAELDRLAHERLGGSEAFVSLKRVRRVVVVVAGEVERPGRYALGPFQTVLDALFAAGGVRRTGSLRDLRLLRAPAVAGTLAPAAADGGTSGPAAEGGILGPAAEGGILGPAAADGTPDTGAGEKRRIDLYRLLLGGSDAYEPRLFDGDRLVVPVLGPTVAVAGQVARPGIYELPVGGDGAGAGAAGPLSVADALALAGGPLRPGPQRLVRLAIGADGRETAVSVTPDSGEKETLAPGDVLLVSPLRETAGGRVHLAGHVHRPGPRPLTTTATLRVLVAPDAVRPNPYLPMAILETEAAGPDPASAPATGAGPGGPRETGIAPRRLEAFDLQALFERRTDRRLRDGDVAIVLGDEDIAFLGSAPVLALLTGTAGTGTASDKTGGLDGHRDRPGPLAPSDCAGLAALAAVLAAEPDGPLAAGPLARMAATMVPNAVSCPPLFERWPALLPFLLRHAVYVGAGALRPGFYPLAGPTTANRVASLALPADDRPPSGRTSSDAPLIDDFLSGSPIAGIARPGDVVGRTAAQASFGGRVRHPGVRRLAEAPTLGAILATRRDLADDAYPLLGLLQRRDSVGLSPALLPFSPLAVVKHEFDRRLFDGDRVHLFSAADLRWLAFGPAREPQARQLSGLAGTSRGNPAQNGFGSQPGKTGRFAADDRRSEGRRSEGRRNDGTRSDPGPETEGLGEGEHGPEEDEEDGNAREIDRAIALALGGGDGAELLADPAVIAFLQSRVVRVEGEVHAPGSYPIADGTPLDALLAVAGGLNAAANPAEIELSRGRDGGSRERINLAAAGAAGRPVFAGDAVRVGARYDPLSAGRAEITGEVRRPGRYPILRGERLSSLLARAGGLTEDAFPAGAVFTRERIRRQERNQMQSFAEQLERTAAVAAARERRPTADQVAQVRELTTLLRAAKPLGRMVVEADPGALAVQPELDPPLENGDHLLIPRRAPTVTVTGEVLAPATLQFRTGKSAEAYLEEAGGLTRYADRDRVFVVLPNGVARPLALAAWNFAPTAVPPGSTVVVPRDPEPFSFLALTDTIGRILSQLAISAVSLSVLHD